MGVNRSIYQRKVKPMSKLPEIASKKLKPYIEKGQREGLWDDETPVKEMFFQKATELKSTLEDLGGLDSDIGQAFVVDAVTIDLSAILRQKKYTAHMEVWEVSHTTVGIATGNPRPVAFIYGQTTLETNGESMEPALFSMSLWGSDASIADDVERDGTYAVIVSCKDTNRDVLDLGVLQGMTRFTAETREHGDRLALMKECFEIDPIAELPDNPSRGRTDFRLIEATVSYAGIQNTRAGGQMGKMSLKDDSTTTLEAIETGEVLTLGAIVSTGMASRYGKYSKVLALATVKNDPKYGLSADIKFCEPIVLIEPPKAEAPKSGDDSSDNAENYFKGAVAEGSDGDKKDGDWDDWE